MRFSDRENPVCLLEGRAGVVSNDAEIVDTPLLGWELETCGG